MNITNAQYVKNEENENCSITITVDNSIASVPIDPANRHYAAILEWVAEGNTIAEAD